MKKVFCTLCAAVALAACLCLPAFAQEAMPAQPAAKEDKVVTDLTGRDAFLRDVKGFTTNFGGPYVFEQASRKSPADIYGAAPAEGSVAVLRIYTMSDDKGDATINASGHAFVSVTNVSDSDIAVGGLLIAPGKSLIIGTRGNRNEHSGIWYELESYYMYYIPDYYYHLYAMQTSLDADQLAVLNRGLSRADHWSAYYNCSAFSEAVWNSVCTDTLSAGRPFSPANLQADMLAKYPDKTAYEPPIPYDYAVYYGKDLAPSKEFS